MRRRRCLLCRIAVVLLLCSVVFLVQNSLMSSKHLYISSNNNLTSFKPLIKTYHSALSLQQDDANTTRPMPRISTNKSGITQGDSTFEKLKFFEPTTTQEEQAIFRNLIEVFTRSISANVTYMMYSGTLLGSFRHGGMIPWDDDLDLIMKNSDKADIKKSLKKLEPRFQLHTKYSNIWKFYIRNETMKSGQWTWPFVDLWFYEEDAKTIRNVNTNWGPLVYDKTDIFPLITRPFMGFMLPAPRYTEKVLLKDFKDLTICESSGYDHHNSKWKSKVSVPCDLLRGKLKFV